MCWKNLVAVHSWFSNHQKNIREVSQPSVCAEFYLNLNIRTWFWRKYGFERYLTILFNYVCLILEKVRFCKVFDLILTLFWPYFNLILTLFWKKSGFARYLTLFWRYFDLILTLFCPYFGKSNVLQGTWPYFDLISTLFWPYFHLILTLFWKK